MRGKSFIALAAAAFGVAAMPLGGAAAQISSVDPDAALEQGDAPVPDSAYGRSGATTDQYAEPDVTVAEQPAGEDGEAYGSGDAGSYAAPDPAYVQPDTPGNETQSYSDAAGPIATPAPGEAETYQEDDLIAAGAGVFGDGAEGLARMIENILAEQGEPNGYIVGREAGGAFIVGVRYGSGTLHHRLEGEQPVYWTGPSIGFDFGGNAAQTLVLVYNLHDTDELFQRFPAVEGDAYFIGGLTASYLRSGDKVLIPIRMGAGLRLGANVGYMKFTREQDWLPF